MDINLNVRGTVTVKVEGLEDMVTPRLVDEPLTRRTHLALQGVPPHTLGGGTTPLPHRTETANYTATRTDYIIGVDTTSSAVTITLPIIVSSDEGRRWVVKDEGGNAATNNITIATEGSETIDGASTDVIDVNYGKGGYYSDGTNLFIL